MKKHVGKYFKLSEEEALALANLVEAGYSFPANTEAGAIRKMIHTAWKIAFPDKPFPTDEEAMCHAPESS